VKTKGDRKVWKSPDVGVTVCPEGGGTSTRLKIVTTRGKKGGKEKEHTEDSSWTVAHDIVGKISKVKKVGYKGRKWRAMEG